LHGKTTLGDPNKSKSGDAIKGKCGSASSNHTAHGSGYNSGK
jgi:hypothetical protein